MTVLWRADIWFCPDCKRLLQRPPYKDDEGRFHSWKCRTPMVHGYVEVRPIEEVTGAA